MGSMAREQRLGPKVRSKVEANACIGSLGPKVGSQGVFKNMEMGLTF